LRLTGHLSRIALDGRVSGAGGFLVRLGPPPTLLGKKREGRNNVVGGVVVREASLVGSQYHPGCIYRASEVMACASSCWEMDP
jgi:hypothetical protein